MFIAGAIFAFVTIALILFIAADSNSYPETPENYFYGLNDKDDAK